MKSFIFEKESERINAWEWEGLSGKCGWPCRPSGVGIVRYLGRVGRGGGAVWMRRAQGFRAAASIIGFSNGLKGF